MSRVRHGLPDGSVVIWGDDPPMGTWFAQFYGPNDSPPHEAPRKVIGYNPDEVALTLSERPDTDIGPYPVKSWVDLRALVSERWGITLKAPLRSATYAPDPPADDPGEDHVDNEGNVTGPGYGGAPEQR